MSRNGEGRRECDHFRLPACNAEATSAHIVYSFSDFPLETLPAAPFAPLERVHQGGEFRLWQRCEMRAPERSQFHRHALSRDDRT